MADPRESEGAAALSYATNAPRVPSRRGKGFLGASASFVLPGLGQFIFGFRRRGLWWFAIGLVFSVIAIIAIWNPALVPALIVLIPLALFLQLAVVIDGYRTARRSPVDLLRWPAARYALGIGIIALANFVHPNLWLAIWVKGHVCEAFMTRAQSMSPTLNQRDRFLVHKRIAPKRWDVVTIAAPDVPGQKYIERLIGLPGERVELVGQQIEINGKPVPLPPGVRPFQSRPPYGLRAGCEGNPILLGKDQCYVLGDNSAISADSRYWGAVPVSSIVGVATWTYWPPSRWRRLSQ